MAIKLLQNNHVFLNAMKSKYKFSGSYLQTNEAFYIGLTYFRSELVKVHLISIRQMKVEHIFVIRQLMLYAIAFEWNSWLQFNVEMPKIINRFSVTFLRLLCFRIHLAQRFWKLYHLKSKTTWWRRKVFAILRLMYFAHESSKIGFILEKIHN